MHTRSIPPLATLLFVAACDPSPPTTDASVPGDAAVVDAPRADDVGAIALDDAAAEDAAPRCSEPSDCPGAVCQEASCADGACGLVPSPAGAPCEGGGCDVAGRCVEATCRFDSDCAVTPPTCQTVRCVSSRCVLYYELIGTPCDGGQCNASGECAGACAGAGECPVPADECRAPRCATAGYCDSSPVADGASCTTGTCRSGRCAEPAALTIMHPDARGQLLSAQGRLYTTVTRGDRRGLAPIDLDARTVGDPVLEYPVPFFDTLRWLTDGDTVVVGDYTSQWSGTAWGPLERTPGGGNGMAMSRDTLWLRDASLSDDSTQYARLGASGWEVAGTVPFDARSVWASADEVLLVSDRFTVVLLAAEGDGFREVARISLPAHRGALAAVASETHVVVAVEPVFASEITGHTLELFERGPDSLTHVRTVPVPLPMGVSLAMQGEHVAGGVSDNPTLLVHTGTGEVRALETEIGTDSVAFTPTHLVLGEVASVRAYSLD